MRIVWFGLICLLLLIVLAELVMLASSFFHKTTPQNTKTKTIIDESPRRLFPEFQWQEANHSDNASNTNIGTLLYLDNQPVHTRITGKAWEAVIKSEIQPAEIEQRLAAESWSNFIEIGDKKLTTIVADGPNESIWGYVKKDELVIKGLIIRKTYISENQTKVQMFISNPLTVDQLK